MQALRTRAVAVARRATTTTMRSTRTYASESHGHNAAPTGAPAGGESMGTAFWLCTGAIPLWMLSNSLAQPGADGEPSKFTKWLESFDYYDMWEERNTYRTKMCEQAAHDKHLFLYAGRNTHIELKTPELMYSGSPWCVPAGHYINLDHVTEHYRKQAAAEDERKAKKFAAAAKPT